MLDTQRGHPLLSRHATPDRVVSGRLPVAAVTEALPKEFEPHPLSEADSLRRRADDPEVLVVDLERDAPGRRSGPARARARLVPVVGLIGADGPPAGWPPTWYAYLPKPVTPFILASALGHAFEHLRLLAEAERTRSELSELNADRRAAVRRAGPGTPSSASSSPRRARSRTATRARSTSWRSRTRAQPRLRFKLTQNDFVCGAVHRVHHADQRRERGRARGHDRRGPAPRGRLRAAARARPSRSTAPSTSRRATAPSRCWSCRCERPRARPSACCSSSTASASPPGASPRWTPSSARPFPIPSAS